MRLPKFPDFIPMCTRRSFIRLIFLLWASLTYLQAADYYVSPAGNDSTGTGTLSSPYLAITKAISVASAGDTLILRAGTYRELVDLTKRLTLRAYKEAQGTPETVVISAMDVVSGWTLDSGNIYKAAMDWEFVTSTDADNDKRGFLQHQIFVNDGGTLQSLTNARWPNLSYTKTTSSNYDDLAHMAAGSGKSGTTNYISATSAWFTNDDSHIAMPQAIRDILAGCLITYRPATMCFSRTNRIPATGALDDRNVNFTNEITLTAEQLLSGNSSIALNSISKFDGSYEYPNIGCSYYLWGKKEFLDTAGEWFRQPSGTASDTGTLYVWMPDGTAPGTRIEAKRRMKTVNIGNMNASENATDTTLDGILIEDITFLGGSISVSRNSDNLTLRRCTFRYTSIMDDTRFNYTARWDRRSLLLSASGALIEDCDFTDMENGIEINGRGNTVRNCTFRNIGTTGLGTAINSNYTDCLSNDGSTGQRNKVENCTFSATAYTAIQLNKGLDVRYNDISGTHRHGNDVGSISLAPDTDALNSEVAYNLVHNSWPMPRNMANGKVFYGAFGIYNDRGSKNLLIHHNVVWNQTGSEVAILKTGTSGGSSDSGRIVDHNTIDGDFSLETGGNTITARNNLAANPIAAAAGLTLAGNIGYSPSSAGWFDTTVQDYRLLSTSRAIDAGSAISGNPYGSYTGTAPDAGAYEGLAAWSTQPGATASAAQIQAASFTADTSADGTSTAITFSGIPAGRKLPATTVAKIGTSSSGGTLLQSVDGDTGAVTVQLHAIPTNGAGGTQAVQLSTDGGTTWLALGSANTDGSKVLGTDIPSTGINPTTGATITLTGHHFLRPTPTTYERTVTIANPANTDLFDYPVLVTLDTAFLIASSQCQADGRDLRFLTADDIDLPYWIESGINTATTRIWVKPPKIPVAGTSLTLVSGDSYLTAVSRGDEVFTFFDDFSGGSLQSPWIGNATQTDSKNNTATIAVTGAHLSISGSIASGQIDYGAAFSVNLPNQAPSFYPQGKHIIESRVRIVQSGGTTTPPGTSWKASVGGDLNYMGINGGQVAYYSSGWQNQSATAVTSGTAVTVGYAVDPADGTATGALWFYENGVLKATRTGQDFINSYNNPIGQGSWSVNPQATGAFEMQIDDVRVRPWVNAEPTTTVGTATTIAGQPLTAAFNGTTVMATWISDSQIQVTLPATTRTYSASETLAVTCGGITFPSYSVTWNTGQTPIEQWRYTHWSNIANSGNGANTADPDGDGLSNLIEYALGGSPTQSGTGILPVISLSADPAYLTLTFTPQHSDIIYSVEASSDLTTWSALTNMPPLTVGQSATATDNTNPISGTTTKRFLRLKVTLP